MKKQKWWRSKGASCSGVGSSLKQKSISLTLNNVSGLFLTLFTGLLASIVISAVEFCIHTYQVSRDENKSFRREATESLRFALMLKDVKHHRTRCQNNRTPNGTQDCERK
uniref:Uncharacterized protein n=1 Tax=Panagrolaimus superbus TaxID=310955 RepID=A0A914YZS1_9BILA